MAKKKRKKAKKAAPSPPPEPEPARERKALWPFAIFLIALALRGWHIAAIRTAPFFSLELGDARSYMAWAREIANGNWLGSDVFYQAPLYPYFIGSIFTFFGDELVAVRIVQAFVGAAACVLLALATARLFSKPEGIVAGAFLALYAPAIFFDGLIQKSTLDLFGVCALLWVLAPLLAKPGVEKSAPRLFTLGVVLGALTLSRENALALIVPLFVWIAVSIADKKRAAVLGITLVLGVAAVLIPVGLRNYAVGGDFLLTTSQLGPNLYIGNNAEADGTYRSLRPRRGDAQYERDDATSLAEEALGRTLTPQQVSDYYVGEVFAFVQREPAAWARLMARKLVLTWNVTEVVDTEDPYSVARYSAPLRWSGALFHFGVLLALAAVGIVTTFTERKRLWPLLAFAAIYAASVVAFYVFARYRYPLVPILVIFASAGLVQSRPFWRTASPKQKLAVIAAAVLSLAVAYLPLVDRDGMRALTHYNWAGGLAAAGDDEEAIAQYRLALEWDADFALAHNNLANLYLASGDAERAGSHLERAVALDEGFEDAHNNLANLLLEKGEPERAERHLREALRLREDYPEAHNSLGNALSALGRTREARSAYEKALALRPNYANAHLNLATLHFEERDVVRARHHFEEAARIDENNAQAWNNLGIIVAMEGDLEVAATHFARALAIDPRYEEARRNLARTRR